MPPPQSRRTFKNTLAAYRRGVESDGTLALAHADALSLAGDRHRRLDADPQLGILLQPPPQRPAQAQGRKSLCIVLCQNVFASASHTQTAQ